ncbi:MULTISPECIES: NADH-quinone oxidoreductase subunit J [Methylocaldum]|jgi:NADH-quinone oxidoreductase subunit J|uniref:NADH-quinone oxidoreductase subunit J n=1 Tax=unclassified Methylocaldum TaxID=2622260 RepID=UPI00098AD121|nr:MULTISPECIES: NADH-quinone oxidoreductase subunit J [unclassified Methylocaldum]MBP1148266.1 NADH-quinone oxidoreductase subunit J [Methylocaldum sp. RMAD-M]MDV3242000.1 NADH-quinone oxidoreductase subunit J [Methylocaldum sp.]MVF22758.1 NADH-quinone oxidoreductase subunit J [Methylocaldum sp. BRCS4]
MLYVLFYSSALISVISTLLVIVSLNAVHALLYVILSLLASGVVFFLMGAYYGAMLQIIVHIGAIMMLFLFVVMMLNLGRRTLEQERKWLPPAAWRWPSAMAAVLLTELIFVLMQEERAALGHIVASKEVGIRLLGPYVLAVELASMLLLAGLVGAYHLTRQEVKK